VAPFPNPIAKKKKKKKKKKKTARSLPNIPERKDYTFIHPQDKKKQNKCVLRKECSHRTIKNSRKARTWRVTN
jgi:hypothetical protein